MTETEVQWSRFCQAVRGRHHRFFDGAAGIVGARAPGRLDVMGGIADYSGSVVLESTLSLATFAAVQRRNDSTIRIRSAGDENARVRECEIDLSVFRDNGALAAVEQVRRTLTGSRDTRWAAYVCGCIYVLLSAGKLSVTDITGLNIVVESDVPIGAGVSSSAALEVSVMTALAGLFGVDIDGMEVARLCQMVENRVVGAPCGIMDQVTCSLGREGTLLALKCQPHEVLGYEVIHPGCKFVGIDSGVKHSVGERAYAKARIGAFMGFAILRQLTGVGWGGYLCNVDAETWRSVCDKIPEEMPGEDFTRLFGPLGDPVSRIFPNETYRVRACTEHPVLENNRVREFLTLMELAQYAGDVELLVEAGNLMLAAHRSYSERVDLGATETDLLVELAMNEGPDRGVYGAKITGGGSGGTVAILCCEGSDETISKIREEYARSTNTMPMLMSGSSPGAAVFGARQIDM